jgi:hypothetical protein
MRVMADRNEIRHHSEFQLDSVEDMRPNDNEELALIDKLYS